MKDKVNNGACSRNILATLAFVATSLTVIQPTQAAKPEPVVVAPAPAYAHLADLVTLSPAIAVVSVRKMTPVPAERAPGLAPGMQRFLVSGDTVSLIRSNDVLARQSSFLLDLPGSPKSKAPKWKGRSFLIFGKVEDRVDFFQLLSSDAIISWSLENEALVRRVSAELRATDAPPLIQGVDSVFHVSGAIAGEGETQIFLLTGDGSPISLSIIRKPDEAPHFGVSLGEIVDEAAAMPTKDTPLWYRLACFLPKELPGPALIGQSGDEAAAAIRDYGAFVSALAPCDRSPTPLD
jgi:hypothetical protein